MDENECDSSVVWNILSYISPEDVVISFYHWDFLQVVFCAVVDFFSVGLYWSL